MKMERTIVSDCDIDQSDNSSSDEEIVAVVCELVFAPRVARGTLLNLEDLSPLECEQLFRYHCIKHSYWSGSYYIICYRFDKSDVTRLFQALSIPPKYVCAQGTTTAGIEALMVLLRRLTYPNRQSDLTKLFGRSKNELSLIFNTVSQ